MYICKYFVASTLVLKSTWITRLYSLRISASVPISLHLTTLKFLLKSLLTSELFPGTYSDSEGVVNSSINVPLRFRVGPIDSRSAWISYS